MSNLAQIPVSPTTAGPVKDDKVLKIATFSLQKYLKESEFADEFLGRGGLQSLCEIIKTTSGNTLAYALNSLTSLMDHDHGWETLDNDFIVSIVAILVNQTLVNICRPATAILIKLACADKTSPNTNIQCYGYDVIHQAMLYQPSFLPTLVQRLQSQDYQLCLNSLSLINALLKHVTDLYRVEFTAMLDSLNVRKTVSRLMNDHPSDELAEHLIEFQSLTIRNAHRRRKTQVSLENERHRGMLEDIWNAAQVHDVQGTTKWKKIGFSTESPQREFHRAGYFALENMYAFTKKDQEAFAKMILEQINRPEDRRCPFAKASVEVTDLLSDYWEISTGYTTTTEFQPLLLSFDAIHHVTIQAFFRLFQEMEATTTDFPKVSALVRSQIKHALRGDGSRSMFEFERAMLGTPYQVIRDRRLKELEWADDLLGREPIKNLRTRLYKQSYDFVKQQRIACLMQGAYFPLPMSQARSMSTGAQGMSAVGGSSLMSPLPTAGSSKRWRFYRLCPNRRILNYGDFAERSMCEIRQEDLQEKIDLTFVTDIHTHSMLANQPKPPKSAYFAPDNTLTTVITNASSISTNNHSSIMGTSPPPSPAPVADPLSFALISGNTVLVQFTCLTSTQYAEWTDGFNLLLDRTIANKDTAEYVHTLTEFGVKIKLLGIGGDRIEVPHGNVDIPSVPPGSGTGFHYNTKVV
ncbi:ELMO/CED-12 family-domain-containing protein [Jimgerdemannia flammicorona]|uniref:ELMO/CED-12 family-domain-containing protein n=1 Tax=Jimgerdemannia flammicorona TaxID=994334 RepID=A0A433B9D3_9FUNG|nr:ELMO/CED-12 family-domain-containing protein [Jimgerdemannia flammicorona]